MQKPELTESSDGTKVWTLNNQLHREDGPAIEWANGTKFWYLNGIKQEPKKYPEHEKFKKNQSSIRQITNFIEWLREEHNITLREEDPTTIDDPDPNYYETFEIHATKFKKLLFEYYEIDEKKMDQEKEEMLNLSCPEQSST